MDGRGDDPEEPPPGVALFHLDDLDLGFIPVDGEGDEENTFVDPPDAVAAEGHIPDQGLHALAYLQHRTCSFPSRFRRPPINGPRHIRNDSSLAPSGTPVNHFPLHRGQMLVMTSPKVCRRENHLENDNVHRIKRDGREIILIGTAHVSRESAELVERVIAEEKPDTVCVELCKPRYEAIRQRDKWQQTDIVKVIREKRTSILLSQLIMASLQRKIAQKLNITPGEEMLRAIARAEEIGAEIVLADREIRVTLLRTWRRWASGAR